MHRFYLEEGIADGRVVITGPDVNHIKNVLRMKCGEEFIACNGSGKDYYCRIISVAPDCIMAEIVREQVVETELPRRIVLYQGLPKQDKMELVIQKAVELGAAEIVPVRMKRCVAKIEEEKKEQKKRERWQMISESAAKQSGRGIVPQVGAVLSFEEALKRAAAEGMVLVPYELAEGMETLKKAVAGIAGSSGATGEEHTGIQPQESGRGITQARESMGQETEQNVRQIAEQNLASAISVFIGPEGGFAAEEIESAQQVGAVLVSLGRRILRTETAGLVMLSILMYELECAGGMESGKLSFDGLPGKSSN